MVGVSVLSAYRPDGAALRAAALAVLLVLPIVAGGGSDPAPPASPGGLQVRVTIPRGVPALTGATLTVRAQDPATRDDLAAAVTETVGTARVVSVLVPGVAEGVAAVVRAVRY